MSVIPSPGMAALTALVLLAPIPSFANEPASDALPAQALAAPGLPNCFAVGANFYSGGQPEGEAAFAQLARLGIKRIVSVDGAKPDLASALATMKALPEVATTSSLVDAMVALDQHFDRLKLAQKAGWNPPPKRPGLAPVHEATLLREQLRKLLRHEDTRLRPEDYCAKLSESEKAADEFRQRLQSAGKDGTPVPADALEAAFTRLGQTCVACQKRYRDE